MSVERTWARGKRRPVGKPLEALTRRGRDEVAEEVFERDKQCVARQTDPRHTCEGRLTLAHVPEVGKNALGKKPPFDRYHLVVECLGANSGGTSPWSEMNRDKERAWLAQKYPDHYEGAVT